MPFYNYYQATGKQYNPQISSNSNASYKAGREGLKSRGYQNGWRNSNYYQKQDQYHRVAPKERVIYRDGDYNQCKRAPTSPILKRPAYINKQQSTKPSPFGDLKDMLWRGSNPIMSHSASTPKGEWHKIWIYYDLFLNIARF